jgi:plasmid stability protein
MTRLPTLYIRNVPVEVYEALKARAKREGRSVNAEALAVLAAVAAYEQSGPESLRARISELAREIDLENDATDMVTLLRRARDVAEDEVVRRLRDENPRWWRRASDP